MNPTAQVASEKFVETMKDEIEQYAKDVMEAVNNAPDGAWIAGSEEQRSRSFRGDAPQGL